MTAKDYRLELADFLRNRRDRLSPTEVGFSNDSRRRTPGLRRDEVALLAGISVEWYTWLEQAREIRVSSETLQQIAQALRLNPIETDYLITLHQGSSLSQRTVSEQIPLRLHCILAELQLAPAFIIGRRWDILAWNQAASFVFGDFSRLPVQERNCLWLHFMERSLRTLIADWEFRTKQILAVFRFKRASYLDDPWFEQIIDRLKGACPEFLPWWQQHEVSNWQDGIRHFHHPVCGKLSFDYTNFEINHSLSPDLRLIAYVPLPNTDTRRKLETALGAHLKVGRLQGQC